MAKALFDFGRCFACSSAGPALAQEVEAAAVEVEEKTSSSLLEFLQAVKELKESRALFTSDAPGTGMFLSILEGCLRTIENSYRSTAESMEYEKRSIRDAISAARREQHALIRSAEVECASFYETFCDTQRAIQERETRVSESQMGGVSEIVQTWNECTGALARSLGDILKMEIIARSEADATDADGAASGGAAWAGEDQRRISEIREGVADAIRFIERTRARPSTSRILSAQAVTEIVFHTHPQIDSLLQILLEKLRRTEAVVRARREEEEEGIKRAARPAAGVAGDVSREDEDRLVVMSEDELVSEIEELERRMRLAYSQAFSEAGGGGADVQEGKRLGRIISYAHAVLASKRRKGSDDSRSIPIAAAAEHAASVVRDLLEGLRKVHSQIEVLWRDLSEVVAPVQRVREETHQIASDFATDRCAHLEQQMSRHALSSQEGVRDSLDVVVGQTISTLESAEDFFRRTSHAIDDICMRVPAFGMGDRMPSEELVEAVEKFRMRARKAVFAWIGEVHRMAVELIDSVSACAEEQSDFAISKMEDFKRSIEDLKMKI